TFWSPTRVAEAVFCTVTPTGADVVVLPAASLATAVSGCEPFVAVVVSHEIAYGAVVTALPRFAPSSLNCTEATPTLSDAFAVTDAVPERVAPAVGAVIETCGGVVSAAAVVKLQLTGLASAVPVDDLIVVASLAV